MRKKFSILESRMKRKSTKGFLFLWKVFRSIFKTVIYVSPLIWKLSRWAHRAFTLPRTLSPLRALKGTTRNFNFEETLMKTKWKEKKCRKHFPVCFSLWFLFFPFALRHIKNMKLLVFLLFVIFRPFCLWLISSFLWRLTRERARNPIIKWKRV